MYMYLCKIRRQLESKGGARLRNLNSGIVHLVSLSEGWAGYRVVRVMGSRFRACAAIAAAALIVMQNVPKSPAADREAARGAFSNLDHNGDGFIDFGENDMMGRRTFAMMDKNGDGVLRLDEIGKGSNERLFAKIDSNGDGVITKDEFLDIGRGRLHKADYDNDGKVSFREYTRGRLR